MQGQFVSHWLKRLKIAKKSSGLIFILFLVCLFLFYFYFDDRFDSVVKDRIYRSAQLSGVKLQKIINEKGIKTIINLRGEWESNNWYKKEKEIAKKNDVRLYNIQLSPHDLPKLYSLISILDILLNGEKPILVHCHRGADRTGIISAIALAIEEDPPLNELKKQFSFRYGVLPFYRSVGPYFFTEYEHWLKKAKKMHNKNNLLYWISNDYIDNNGNLEYWVDTVNDKRFNKDRRVYMENSPEKFSMKGWTFDFRTKSPVDNLFVVVDGKISSKAIFNYNRPDVARAYRLGEKYYTDFVVGWEAELEIEGSADSCHRISLKLVKDESDIRNIPAGFEFCLN